MLQITPVDLTPGDLDHNYRELLVWAMVIPADDISDEELKEEERELLRHITGFHINSSEYGEESYAVGEGKYRTAALLLYLSMVHAMDSFRLGPDDVAFIKSYYPVDLIIDAEQNPHTKHIALRSLLSRGAVQVKVDHTVPY